MSPYRRPRLAIEILYCRLCLLRYATSKEVGVDAGGCYRGTWQDNARCGWGAMRWPSGERYEGAWQDDTRHGKGEGPTVLTTITGGSAPLGLACTTHHAWLRGRAEKKTS